MDKDELLAALNENLSLETEDAITELEREDTYRRVESFTAQFRGHPIEIELLEHDGTTPPSARYMLAVSEVVPGGVRRIWVSNLEDSFETAIQTFQWHRVDTFDWS